MTSPTNDNAEGKKDEEIAEMFYCLVPVMAVVAGKDKEEVDDTGTTTTTTTCTKLMLPDGSIAAISSEAARDLLTVREAERIRPGVAKRNGLAGRLANSLSFNKEGSDASVLRQLQTCPPRTSGATESSRDPMANIVSPPAAGGTAATGKNGGGWFGDPTGARSQVRSS